MNDKHKQRVLFDAVTGIDEDLIDEAAAPRMLAFPRRVLRVASIAAILALLLTWLLWPGNVKTDEDGNIISAPGILKVYACELEDDMDLDELEKYELTDAIDSYRKVMVPYVSGLDVGFPIPFTFQIPDNYFGDAEISFLVSADYGKLFVDEWPFSPDQEIEFGNGDRICWSYTNINEAKETIGSGGRFYANVIIYAEEEIVGYGIIDFVFFAEEGMLPSFVTTGFTTVCFPLVDGEFQDVSEEYVWAQIEEYKRTKPAWEEEMQDHGDKEGMPEKN